MNGNGRHDGWNHNQNMENRQMNQNHSGSCGCGCQQNQNEYNGANNGSHSSNEYNGANNGSYSSNGYNSNNNGSYPSTEYNSNNNGSYPSTEYVKGYSIGDDLPLESKQFQKISNVNTSGSHRAIDAKDTEIGYQIDNRVSGPCKGVDYQNTVTYEQTAIGGDSQFLIFYQTDSGRYIIANRENGRVLEVISSSINNFVTISNMFNGFQNQNFIMTKSADNSSFSLTTENNKTLNICNHEFEYNTKITALENANRNDNYLLFKPTSDTINVSFPTLPSLTTLPDPSSLTSLDDRGIEPNNAPRAIIGNALIPAILVNDGDISDRIKTNPYYRLTYKQYWHKTWSVQIPAFGRQTVRDITGMYPNTQTEMKNIIDISIGNDWKLRFFNKSKLFQKQIYEGLNMLPSQSNDNLEFVTFDYDKLNTTQNEVRFVKYNLAYEFELTFANGIRVMAPWVMYTPEEIIKTYPNNIN